MSNFLNVPSSLNGRRWIEPSVETERLAEAMAQEAGLPGALCMTLARLGVGAREARGYLEPQLRHLLPDPRGLRDMEKAAQWFLKAVEKRQRIAAP